MSLSIVTQRLKSSWLLPGIRKSLSDLTMLLPECTRVPRRFIGYGAYGLYGIKDVSDLQE